MSDYNLLNDPIVATRDREEKIGVLVEDRISSLMQTNGLAFEVMEGDRELWRGLFRQLPDAFLDREVYELMERRANYGTSCARGH